MAEEQSKELEELENQFTTKKSQLESLQKHALMSETDYRNLPETYEELIEIAMGGTALKAMLDEIDLDKLIADLQQESEDARGQRQGDLISQSSHLPLVKVFLIYSKL